MVVLHHCCRCRCYTTATGADVTLLLQVQMLHQCCRCRCYTTAAGAGATPLLQVQVLHHCYRCRCYTTAAGAGATPLLQVQVQVLHHCCRCYTTATGAGATPLLQVVVMQPWSQESLCHVICGEDGGLSDVLTSHHHCDGVACDRPNCMMVPVWSLCSHVTCAVQ
ncbi:hypothetical protein FHG87_014908 [Trinorchestia longiramus]|nr:hypothetical protein FHG87_014908 [Trinorchestia longiramus]